MKYSVCSATRRNKLFAFFNISFIVIYVKSLKYSNKLFTEDTTKCPFWFFRLK